VKRFEDLDRGDTDTNQPGMYDVSRGKGIGENLKVKYEIIAVDDDVDIYLIENITTCGL
jgi:hypothetical protein